MEQSRLFRTIRRINSVLFLLILIGTAVTIIIFLLGSNGRRTTRTVAVTGGHDGGDAQRVEMVLGSLEEIHGHDAHFVQLSAKRKRGKYSSGYTGGQTRNVLFFVGPELQTRWLYRDHANLIATVSRLDRDTGDVKDRVTRALFIRVIQDDTDGDGTLSLKDLSTIALTKPDGSGYTEIETGVQSLIDREVSDNGRSLMLLLQSDNRVYLKKYSLTDFSTITEKPLTEIHKSD